MKKSGEPKKHSLKGLLVKMALFCWVVPLLLVITVVGLFSSRQIRAQVLAGVQENTAHAAHVCAGQLDSAVNASYEATFNSDILYTAHRAFLEGPSDVRGDKDQLFASATSYLRSQYRYDTRFDMAMMSYSDAPDTIYYTYDTFRGATFSQFTDYHKRVHARILSYAERLGTHVGFYSDPATGNVFLVRNLVDGYDFQPYAVLVLQLNRENFFANLTTISYSSDVTIWLEDTAVPLKGGEIPAGALQGAQDGHLTLLSGSEAFDSYRLRYAVRVDSSLLTKTLSYTHNLVLVLSLLSIPLFLTAIGFFYRHITHPIRVIEDAFKKLGKGRLGVTVQQAFSTNEFSYFADSFNRMSAKLHRQFEQIYSDELALRDARIMALQSQINPHFLNNSLEIINWEARLSGNDRVGDMIGALSTMLDAAMDRSHTPEIPLHQELQYVNAYLFIIGQRFGKRLTIQKEIDQSLLGNLVPRLVMQPILENAVEHGVEQQNDGRITLRVRAQGGLLLLEVENSGALSDADKAKIDRLLSADYDATRERSTNLGIHNVHQRLRILYGPDSGLSISSTEQRTTVARLRMPLHVCPEK